MTILNRYKILTDSRVDHVKTSVNNVNPNEKTGASGNSDNLSPVYSYENYSVYIDQVSTKLVEIHVHNNIVPIIAAYSYLTVDLVKLGISGVRPVLAAQLLGVYDPNSIEQVAAGATPSFIGVWDRDPADLVVLSIVNSKLILKISTNNFNLFMNKVVMINLIYKQEVNYF